MTTIKTIIGPDGKEAKAKEVPFRVSQENWSEYNLEDGTVVRLRTTALKILQVLDDQGNPRRTPDGDPIIVVNHNTVIVASG